MLISDTIRAWPDATSIATVWHAPHLETEPVKHQRHYGPSYHERRLQQLYVFYLAYASAAC